MAEPEPSRSQQLTQQGIAACAQCQELVARSPLQRLQDSYHSLTLPSTVPPLNVQHGQGRDEVATPSIAMQLPSACLEACPCS